MDERKASDRRETSETKVSVELNLDGTGEYQIDTGNGFFDHLLAQLSRHGLMDLKVSVQGDKETGLHHTVEDAAIVLGRVFRKAIGDGKGITRMAHAFVPLDETLAMVALDIGGRGYAVLEINLTEQDMAGLSPDLVRHFLETFAREGAVTLHAKTITGTNNHHKAEALFKALARATRDAVKIDERSAGQVPSTKGAIG